MRKVKPFIRTKQDEKETVEALEQLSGLGQANITGLTENIIDEFGDGESSKLDELVSIAIKAFDPKVNERLEDEQWSSLKKNFEYSVKAILSNSESNEYLGKIVEAWINYHTNCHLVDDRHRYVKLRQLLDNAGKIYNKEKNLC